MTKQEYNEYKRRYRAAHKNKHDGDAYFFASCLSIHHADCYGGGILTDFALVFDSGVCITGNGITSVFDAFKRVKQRNTIFISNLKVWGRFLTAEAQRRGYKATETIAPATYRVVVNNTGDWLAIELNIDGQRVFIKDFSGIIRVPIDKAYFDFCGHYLPDDARPVDVALAMRDVMASFLSAVKVIAGGVPIKANTISGFAQGLCNTIAGLGCPSYGKDVFRATFPEISKEIGDDLRESKVYRGGFNYIAPAALEYTGGGWIFDVNSFYPSIYSGELPVGEPTKIDGNDIDESDYIQGGYAIYKILDLCATLKAKGVPTIQLINDKTETEYLTKINYSGGFNFMLDSFDLLNLYENYDVDFLTYDYAYTFESREVPFLQKYAEKLYRLKNENKGTALGVCAKYLLNSLTGRFGLNAYRREVDLSRGNYSGEMKYVGEKGYLPAAIKINSYGRLLISDLARKCKEVFLYSDTDSIIIKGDEIPEFIKSLIGNEMGRLSAKRFTESKFFGQKCYGVKMLDGWKWTVAGATPVMLKKLDETAYAGQVLKGGVVPKVYPDGTIAFKEREFTLARNTLF